MLTCVRYMPSVSLSCELPGFLKKPFGAPASLVCCFDTAKEGCGRPGQALCLKSQLCSHEVDAQPHDSSCRPKDLQLARRVCGDELQMW